jgi:hypothetical protein
MRMIVSWDGSGHALKALRGIVGLFREGAVEHIEIILTVWPPRDVALWSDINERAVLADDLHRAAAEVAAADVRELEDLLRPIARSITSSTTDGHFAEVIGPAIERTRSDLLFVLAGTHDEHHVIAETLQSVVAESRIPTWLLRPPAK